MSDSKKVKEAYAKGVLDSEKPPKGFMREFFFNEWNYNPPKDAGESEAYKQGWKDGKKS